ncbi:RDD family protein [Gleimia europaea]|nr:RDD family protein [Gleimia europaea]MDK8533411.1 RDD family protein [Gleimia europaea]
MDSQAMTVTTGEGVALDVVPAGIGLRMLSALIDVGLSVAVLIWVAVAQFKYLFSDTSAAQEALFILLVVFAVFVAPVLIETTTGGKSLGRFVVGTRVVRSDLRRVGMQQAAIRAMVGLVEIWATMGGLAAAAALIDPKNRRLGDLAAGTVVIKERVGTRTVETASKRADAIVHAHQAPATPSWIQSADLRRLPPELARNARSLLMRSAQFDEQARARLLTGIACELREYVFPGPPPGVGDEDFIAAVLAERTRREAVRLERNRRLASSFLRV